MSKIRVSLKREETLRATRVTAGKDKLVYVLITDKRLKYRQGKSRIAYIGTTRKGVARIAQSVAVRAERILSVRGVRTFHVRIMTSARRQNVRTWAKLERALLLRFRDRFGDVPMCNSHGRKMKVTDEFKYFRLARIDNLIDDLS